MMRRLLAVVGAATAMLASACYSADIDIAQESKVLAGETISAATLSKGREAYMHYCYACHGMEGKGDGPAAKGLRPPPRDFTAGTGIIKFSKTPDGLPNDEDLARIIRGGLSGTAMLPWDVPDDLLYPIVHYIKSLMPEYLDPDEEYGDLVEMTDDPWKRNKKEGVARGVVVYHGDAGCQGCHAAYITKPEIAAALSGAGKAIEIEDNPYQPQLKPSSIKVGDHVLQILPPDFLFHQVRSGESVEELFKTLAGGVRPVMPPWQGSLDDEDIWAMAYYVNSLIKMKDTPKALELQDKLARQPAWSPPAPPTPEPAPTPADSAAPADGAAPPTP